MRKIVWIQIIWVFIVGFVFADEGLWRLDGDSALFNKMKERGLEVSFDEMYGEDISSLKDAVVSFNGSATGAIVSKDGLVLTNYHCGYKHLLKHSRSKDLITNGFYAKTLDEELPNQRLAVHFLRKIVDVTDSLLLGLDKSGSLKDFNARMDSNRKQLMDVYKERYPDLEVEIKKGNVDGRYFLYLYETYRDIRTVYMPPMCIGKFGGDLDNWRWPRYTGDFAFFRIYADSLNKPALYSEKNTPYRAEKNLIFSKNRYEEGDFSMVIGYPGHTKHLIYSGLLRNYTEIEIPLRYRLLKLNREIMEKDKPSEKKEAILLSLRNQEEKLHRTLTIDSLEILVNKKKREEMYTLNNLVPSSKRDALQAILSSFQQKSEDMQAYLPPYLCYAYGFSNMVAFQWVELLKSSDVINVGNKERSNSKTKFNLKEYDVELDKKLFANLMDIYHSVCDTFFHFPFNECGKDWKSYSDSLYAHSLYASTDSVYKYLQENPLRLCQDTMYTIVNQMTSLWGEKLWSRYPSLLEQLGSLELEYYKLLEDAGTEEWPDANGTMRLSYGVIKGSKKKSFVTHISDILKHAELRGEKLPEDLKSLYEKYSSDKQLRVCFVTNCQTSSGNSGSPVLNAKGELIGLNFDRNEMGTIGDYIYNDQFRNIVVDTQYILFVLKEYGKCDRLLKEIICQ